ncbi:regucalcin-like isoform X2 [Zootermopsis nevadensis]|uniref:regucalcin-like isoform X2 n=1 Tax=Zootermopsis nevadensis TaxID=136037 RepID=UPI000B8EB654|nr:regucalcin-like isoform X2 [Zootermopsis nevadensis]
MSGPKVEKISAPVSLGEGPHWDHDAETLYYVDIKGPTVHKYVPATNKHTAVKIDGVHVSLVIPLEGTKDKFVITVGRNVAILTWDGESSTPTDVKYVSAVDNEKELQGNKLNDGKADPTGRLWTANRRTAFDFEINEVDGFPDGMAIDIEGKLWVACFGGSQVIRVDPASGKLLSRIPIPTPQVTSVAFGGPQLDELYVTSGNILLNEGQKEAYPESGATFRVTGLGVKGLPGQPIKL